ncbi:MAG TPA: 50S ribosomal protein L15 [Clostridiales bacterium]|nr:50S ribosomal protein L15 [Clostridiales bacterium]
MRTHELAPAPGSRKERRRVGRGIGSGRGKTAGRGHKGQRARSGRGKGPQFEGGQMPLAMRLPKRGFKNPSRKVFALVDLDDLDRFDEGTVVTPEVLLEKRVIRKVLDGVKVLGDGELSKALTVRAHRFSRSAVRKIEAAGGKTEVI